MLNMKHLQPLYIFGSWLPGPVEIAVVVLMALLLISVIIYSFFFYRKQQEKNHSKLMKEKYDKYLLRLNLSDEELTYTEKLSAFLENPDLRYHMLTDRRSFATCADTLAKKEKIPKGLREGMEKKLNFPTAVESANYFSSEELPVGMPSLLIFDETRKVSAVISENNRGALTLKTKNPLPPFREGTRLNVYFHDNQKIFTINTTVQEQKDQFITVSHSLLESQKRRTFKRKKVRLPVVVKHMEGGELPKHSYITDLSEGGASLENPDFTFRRHDRIILYYHIEADEGFQIRAEVLRLSAKGRMIHVQFLDRDLTLRSRIKTIVK